VQQAEQARARLSLPKIVPPAPKPVELPKKQQPEEAAATEGAAAEGASPEAAATEAAPAEENT
jgi:hypothetical protein